MEQISIFDFTRETFSIDKPIRLIELFAGYGSQAMALERLGANFEHYLAVEFDKYANASYNAVHGTSFPVLDVTKISGDDLKIIATDKYCYIMTYSFPCTDLSVAGRMAGMAEGSGTRSSLLWEVRRLLSETQHLPQVLLMENVPQIHSEENIPHFRKWIQFLESLGYSSYVEDLNAKNYGVAQNRERCFVLSLLGDYNYKFPNPIGLRYVMKDYLEKEVDEKYYLKTDKAQELLDKLIADGTIGDRQTDRQVISGSSTQTEPYLESMLLKNMATKRLTPMGMPVDLAVTLCARDYKGFNNYGSNGVITTKLNMSNPKSIDVAQTITTYEGSRGMSHKFNTSSNGVIHEQ